MRRLMTCAKESYRGFLVHNFLAGPATLPCLITVKLQWTRIAHPSLIIFGVDRLRHSYFQFLPHPRVLRS